MELILEMNMLFNSQMEENKDSCDQPDKDMMAALSFIRSALEAYFDGIGCLTGEAVKLQMESVAPESELGQKFAKKYWGTMMEMSGGNIEFLQSMSEYTIKAHSSEDNPESSNFMAAHRYIESALETYFKNQHENN
jgi:hypothetical protein